jgi:hypothetical protein
MAAHNWAYNRWQAFAMVGKFSSHLFIYIFIFRKGGEGA